MSHNACDVTLILYISGINSKKIFYFFYIFLEFIFSQRSAIFFCSVRPARVTFLLDCLSDQLTQRISIDVQLDWVIWNDHLFNIDHDNNYLDLILVSISNLTKITSIEAMPVRNSTDQICDRGQINIVNHFWKFN